MKSGAHQFHGGGGRGRHLVSIVGGNIVNFDHIFVQVTSTVGNCITDSLRLRRLLIKEEHAIRITCSYGKDQRIFPSRSRLGRIAFVDVNRPLG